MASVGSTMIDRLDRAGEFTGSFKVVAWPEGRTESCGGSGTTIAYDGEFIWASMASTNSVVKLDSSGAVLGEYAVGR